MMAKHGTGAVKDFTSRVYGEFGMRIVILAAYVDTEGEHTMALWVYYAPFIRISHNIK
jgi:hypothetical protein